jgi:shikimate dehydrogenase
MHNAAFQALGLNWMYVPLPVQSDLIHAALNGLTALGFRGANVTVPHKESVIQFIDALSPDAACIGAVNTLVVKEGKLLGLNTDWMGFLNDLSEIGFDVSGRNALVLGSGGSARAVVYALCSRGTRVIICSRNAATSEAIIRDMTKLFPDCHLRHVSLKNIDALSSPADLVVNTTPVGMSPDHDSCPWPEAVPFPKCDLAYDLVYNPKKTRFMETAETCGIKSVNGLGMLVHQAAAAFKIWIGIDPPIEIMKKAVS